MEQPCRRHSDTSGSALAGRGTKSAAAAQGRRGAGAHTARVGASLAARIVVRLVVSQTGLAEQKILAPNRGNAEVSHGRQLAMYLMHTSLSLPYSEIAGAFARDRTTVSHACRQIEDQRDDAALNAMLCELEGILELIRPLAAASLGDGN